MTAVAATRERAEAGEAPLRTPWPATAAALVAFAALAVAGGRYAVLAPLGAAVLVAALARARLPAGAVLPWLIRAVLYMLVLTANTVEPAGGPASELYDPALVQAVGELCAAELALQAWRARPAGGRDGAYVVLLSWIVFGAACHRQNLFGDVRRQPLPFFAPAYAALLLLTLRRLGAPPVVVGRPAAPVPGRARWLAAGSIALALGLGLGSALLLRRYMEDLNRLSSALFIRLAGAQGGEVGFSGSPSLGATDGMTRSLARVLRVEGRLHDPHLRGAAFEVYGRGRWTPAIEGRRFAPLAVSALAPPPGASGARCRFTRLVETPDLLFLPLESVGVEVRGVDAVDWDTREESCLRASGELPLEYACVLPGAPGERGLLDAPPSKERLARLLMVPFGPQEVDPRIRDTAREIAAGATGARAKASAVEGWLQANRSYSLRSHQSAGDPVSRFILDGKSAHCEFFASAAVLLLRALGVPARYVVGYYAHEWDGPEQWIVRQQDAHAWCEAWVDGEGWITVEATPASGLPDRTAEPPGLARRLWERLRDTAGAALSAAASRGQGHLGLILAASGSAMIVLRGALGALRRLRRPAVARVYAADPRLARVAARFERHLERRGAPCPAARTWREHLRDLALEPARAPALDLERALALAREYNRIRFGPPADAGVLESLERDLSGLERGRPLSPTLKPEA